MLFYYLLIPFIWYMLGVIGCVFAVLTEESGEITVGDLFRMAALCLLGPIFTIMFIYELSVNKRWDQVVVFRFGKAKEYHNRYGESLKKNTEGDLWN